MKSMTGYAFKEAVRDHITVSVEIKSYNSRYLDLSLYLPPWLAELGMELRTFIGSRFNRGKVEAGIRLKEEAPSFSVTVNQNAVLAYQKAFEETSKILGIKEEPHLAMFLGLQGVLETETNRDIEKYRSLIMGVLADAVDQCDGERSREGSHTQADILKHLAVLEDAVKAVSGQVPELETSIKKTLHSRFEELLQGKFEIDENRILSETAILLMKHTISEELSRLSSHLGEFRLEVEKNPAPGKKLDFLCQEINREVNTIGSKTPVLEVSWAVITMKNALENIREQLRNVE